MNAWVKSVQDGTHVGASAWDGYVATAIAEQLVVALRSDSKVSLFPGSLPALYI
jgi:myo-inositol 2-dehydrogenase/D-chiro-inositol 1-dehydrogenase